MAHSDIRLGVIGLSAGNGHPYSWSAIFNGYDPVWMERCGFPVIPQYLGAQRFPEAAIAGARVTHVWTQDPEITELVAKAALIPTRVARPEDMIGEIDAVLLARDDPESHRELAEPFLRAGLPIYIDKPLATTVAEAEAILAMETYPGQVFTCSAMRYAREFVPSEEVFSKIGRVRLVQASATKDWDKYAVHVVEPALAAVPERGALAGAHVLDHDGIRIVSAEWDGGLKTIFSVHGELLSTPFWIRLIGDSGYHDMVFQDTFAAFKRALEAFIGSVRSRAPAIEREFVLDVVRVIEAGRQHAG